MWPLPGAGGGGGRAPGARFAQRLKAETTTARMGAGGCRDGCSHLSSRCRDGCGSEARRAPDGRCPPLRAGLPPCSAAALVACMRSSCSDGGMGRGADATRGRGQAALKTAAGRCSSCCAVPWVARGEGARQFAAAQNARGGVQPGMLGSSSISLVCWSAAHRLPPSAPPPRGLQTTDPPRPTFLYVGTFQNWGRPSPRAAPRAVGGQQAGGPSPCVTSIVSRPDRVGYTNSIGGNITAQDCSRQLRTAEGARKKGQVGVRGASHGRRRAGGRRLSSCLTPAATPHTPASPPDGTQQPQPRGPPP